MGNLAQAVQKNDNLFSSGGARIGFQKYKTFVTSQQDRAGVSSWISVDSVMMDESVSL